MEGMSTNYKKIEYVDRMLKALGTHEAVSAFIEGDDREDVIEIANMRLAELEGGDKTPGAVSSAVAAPKAAQMKQGETQKITKKEEAFKQSPDVHKSIITWRGGKVVTDHYDEKGHRIES
jgi:hypothetical protein